jgi:hypothetical protein
MQCADVRAFMSQIAAKSVSMQIQQADMDFLCSNGYLSVMQKEEYDQALAEVSNLTHLNTDQQSEMNQERSAESTLKEEEKKTHSIVFHFESKEKKEAEIEAFQSEKNLVSKAEAEIAERDSKIKELIEKKSMVDRMTQYDETYLSLTGLGVMTLSDLNVRNYRVSGNEFSDFIEESKEIHGELLSIADKGSFYVSGLRKEYGEADLSQLWSVSIGLGKLQGDPNLLNQRFLLALGALQHFDSTLVNKMMAAEIMTAFGAGLSQTPANSDLQNLAATLATLDRELRHDAKVPKPLSTGVAAIVMFGRRFDGTFPTDRFVEFSKMTSSCESAAILSIMNLPTDQLASKFQSFRSLFDSWGYEMSEDTELASAYLSISDLEPGDVNTKMTIIVDALKNYLEYPLVASAIVASVPTLEANETLDLMEKAYSLLGPYAPNLEPSELLSLAVRMIHGVKNELVKELDPTAKIMNTPIQFTYVPSGIFFIYHAPLIIVHSSYYSTFSGIGGFHPAHVHGVGGFMG